MNCKKKCIVLIVLFLTVARVALAKNAHENLYSIRMANSEMARYDSPWETGNASKPKWNYHIGVLNKALLDVYEYTRDKKYFSYVERYYDMMIDEEANIKEYRLEKFNIDHVNPGKDLFPLFKKTAKFKYRMAIDTLRYQMELHPRTKEGGFWHKKRYPWQMWLDGLYMGAPFLAQYAVEFNEPELLDDVVNQFVYMDAHSYDIETSLFYHGYDESREQRWADKETGLSKHFWARGLGWFTMAQVDVLDFLPQDHPGRPLLIDMVKRTAVGVAKYQDVESGVWYQVLDQGDREGNYLEASASSMFTYFLFKAVRKGYIDESYLPTAEKAYNGLIKTFIRENEDGTITLKDCCLGAGLGGDPYRDGSFEYYISEEIVENDAKGVGPFIWASMEYEMFKGLKYSHYERQPAFPDAQGFGANAKGGRGGIVLFVDNLNDSGPGSLREAVETNAPRTIVFNVSGTIKLESILYINHPYLTIAGQTAPGDGICISNFPVKLKDTHDVIIRNIRIRPGTGSGLDGGAIDGMEIRKAEDVIIDHCSFSWTVDEVVNTWHGTKNITVQWCILADALNNSIHKSGSHGYGASIGGFRTFYHHNLFANCRGRNPSVGGDKKDSTYDLNFTNNVVYNWGDRTCDGKPRTANFIGNYYKAGPATSEGTKGRLLRVDNSSRYNFSSKWYINDNVLVGNQTLTENNLKAVVYQKGTSENKNISTKPFDMGTYRIQDPNKVYKNVLKCAGAIAPVRDAIDQRVVKEVKTGKPTYGNGLIDTVERAGGWPELKSKKSLQDSDRDGMPDRWEKKNKLNPNSPDDRNYMAPNGYTNLENYLNELMSL